MIDPTRQPEHYPWSRFFRQPSPHIHTRYWELNQQEITPPHSHEFIEIITIAAGSVPHQTIHGITTLKAGDIVVLRPGSWHAYGKAERIQAFNLCFIESVLTSQVPFIADNHMINNLLFKAPLEPEQRGILRLHMDKSTLSQLVSWLKVLDDIDRSKDIAAFMTEKTGLFLACLGLIARTAYATCSHAAEKPMHAYTRRAMELMEADSSQPFSLQCLAETLRINKSYLARLFKKDTGMTVADFLTRRRAEIAAVFLINTNKTVAEIAQLTGWDDPNYFARRFRSFYGMPASEYRRVTRKPV